MPTDEVCAKICILVRNGSAKHVMVDFKKAVTHTAI